MMLEYLGGLTVYAVLLGFFAWRGWRRVKNVSDYVLGGRRLGWFVTGLSAGATGMSGWLMLGLPGETYHVGGEVFWLLLGLILGLAANWVLVSGRLRTASAALGDALTLPVFLAARAGAKETDRWTAIPSLVRRTTGVIVLIFLGLYAATGMVAGGKLFATVFDMNYQLGVVLITGIVLIYSLLGGFLSISWSDVLQALMMFLVLLLTAVMVQFVLVSPEPLLSAQQAADLANPFRMPDGQTIGMIAVISGLSWGLGYFGQPHILARFKAMRDPKVARGAFPVALVWACLCMFAACVIGFTARLNLDLPDPERALLYFIELFYNPWIGGFALAAVLAAMMSTADSQLLVAATAFTHDLLDGERRRSLRLDRLALAALAVFAMILALDPDNSVFNLVAYAWAGLGGSLGPVVLLSLFWKRLTGAGILAAVVGGAGTVFAWEYLPGVADSGLYVLGPAFCISMALGVGLSLLTAPPAANTAVAHN